MKNFVRYASDDTLILIDEFGTGTEPMLGGAIAEAILNALNQNQVKGVITTHYTNLKHFASSAPGIVNGAMLYDSHRMLPLFQLEIGKPGSSFAFEIAKKIGLPKEILEDAAGKIGEDRVNFDKHLKEILRDKRYWEEKRKRIHDNEKRLEEVLERYKKELDDASKLRKEIIKEAQVLFFAPPMISGYSASSDIELNMQDKTGGDLNHFFDVVKSYNAALEARPEINSAKTTFNPSFPQYMLDIDAAACKKAGISPSDILSTMQGYFGGLYASNFNSFGKMYRVMVQAEPEATKNLESLSSIKVRNGDEMAPITQFVSIKKVYGPDIISRFNLYTSMKVMVAPASGYTSGQALAAIAEVAKENLPAGFAYELGGMAREEAETSGSTTGLIFVLCFVFVYLLLSAQYESYILPLAVLLSVPFGLLGSFLFVNGVSAIGNISMLKMILGTMSNNIYMQIALIMLMGLLAKNAILIVEFALDRRKMGMSITWAAVLGAGARLRPILMTSLAMVVGLLPLMFAFGVGAHGNRTLGTASIGGMLIGMICQIFIVPALFVIFQYLQEKVKPMEWEDIDNADAVTEIEQYAK